MKNNLSPEQFTTALCDMGACEEALGWAKGLGYNAAWNSCHNPDWMLFLIKKAAPLTVIVNELLVCRFAHEAVHLNTDPRVLACIETREAWARGKATDEERAAVLAAAWDAARDAVGGGTYNAAWAAAMAAAMDAAGAAAGAAAMAAARATAGVAAMDAMRAKQCDIIRELVAQPELGL